METINKIVYKCSIDGKLFETESDCQLYENGLKEEEKKTTYWFVRYGADLTEGRGLTASILLKVYMHRDWYPVEGLVRDYCARNFGREVDFVQGVQPTMNWIVKSVDKDEVRKSVDILPLSLGERTTGLQVTK